MRSYYVVRWEREEVVTTTIYRLWFFENLVSKIINTVEQADTANILSINKL